MRTSSVLAALFLIACDYGAPVEMPAPVPPATPGPDDVSGAFDREPAAAAPAVRVAAPPPASFIIHYIRE